MRNVLLLAKAKETPHHVWLFHHTSLFTLTIETKRSFKVVNIQNITKHTYSKKKATKLKTLQTSSRRSAVQTSTEHVLWKREEFGASLFKHSDVIKRRHVKRIQQHYKRKHDSAICPSRILSMATENRDDIFTIATVSAFYNCNRA